MADDLTFYTNPQSRGRIVRWMLEEAGVHYRTEMVEYGEPMKSAAYLAINPMGKVPAIRHRGSVVTEAAAICAYLADAYPDAGLPPPPGSAARTIDGSSSRRDRWRRRRPIAIWASSRRPTSRRWSDMEATRR